MSDTEDPSNEDDESALTCAITTCAFMASSSSAFIRACLQAARFSASIARNSAAVGVDRLSCKENKVKCFAIVAHEIFR